MIGLRDCHESCIVHRDIQPDNILVQIESDDSSIKISDFGVSEIAKTDDSLKSLIRASNFIAPEIISGRPYGKPVDVWSCGVLMYTIIGGYSPFFADKVIDLCRKIVAGDVEHDPQYWRHVSREAKDLIRRMLTVNPSRRITINEALEHPWFRIPSMVLSQNDLSLNLKELKKHIIRRRFRTAVKTIVGVNKLFNGMKTSFGGSNKQQASRAATSPLSSNNSSPDGQKTKKSSRR